MRKATRHFLDSYHAALAGIAAVDSLAEAYRAPALAAGLDLRPSTASD